MKELGKYLEEERLQRQLSLREVSEKTRISVKVLRSLEQGTPEDIRTPVLIRGFVRSYCSLMGIDPEPLLERYGPEIQAYGMQSQKLHGLREINQSEHRKGRILLALVLLGAIGLGGWASIIWMSKRNAQLQSVPAPLLTGTDSHDELLSELSKREVANQASGIKGGAPSEAGQLNVSTTKAAPEEPIQQPKAVTENLGSSIPQSGISSKSSQIGMSSLDTSAQAPPTSGSHRLVAEADKETWLQVVIDGKTTKNTLLKPGEKREWEASDNIRLVVGNARGVRITWDNVPVDYPGKPGQVIKLRFPDGKTEGRTTRQ